MSNLLESVRNRVKALEPHSDTSVLRKSVDEKLKFIWDHREIFIEAWVAETGIHPSQCMLVEKRSFDGAFGTMSISIVAKSQEQIDAEIEAAKPKPARVADYLQPDPFSMTVGGKCSRWTSKTFAVGSQPEGSVMVPNSERDSSE